MSNEIHPFVGDRFSDYDILPELKLLKKLQKSLYLPEDTFLIKNDDKVGYDVSVIQYLRDKEGEWIKKEIAYIEIEVSNRWINSWPESWSHYSFLARKVLKYIPDISQFTNSLKDPQKTPKAIYLICNKQLTDCFCSDMVTISNFNMVTKHNFYNGNVKVVSPYHSTTLVAPLWSKNVVRGWENVIKFIEIFILKRREVNG